MRAHYFALADAGEFRVIANPCYNGWYSPGTRRYAMPRLAIFIAALSLVLVTGPAAAQSGPTLEQQLQSASGIERVELLAKLVDTLRTSDPALAIQYGQQGIALLKSQPNPILEADLLNEMSWSYRVLGDHTSALRSAEQALGIAKRSDYDQGAARAHNNIGVVYFYLGDNDQALEQWLTALQLREALGDDLGVAGSLNNIGLLYSRQGEYQRAINHFNRALALSRAVGNQDYELNHLDNLGEAYTALGQYEAAEQEYGAALAIANSIEKIEGKVSVLVNLGAMYLDAGNWMLAKQYLLEGQQLAKSLGGKSKQAESGYYLAQLYRGQAQIREAIVAAETALSTADELREKHLKRDLLKLLAELHESEGQPATALSYMKRFSVLQEQLFESERVDKVAALQTRFEVAETERQMDLLVKDKAIQSLELEAAKTSERLLLSVIFAVTFVCFVLLLAYRSRTRSRSRLATIASNYNKLLQSLPLGVLALDGESNIQFANDALLDITVHQEGALEKLKSHATAMLQEQKSVEEWQLNLTDMPPKSLLLVVEQRLDEQGDASGLWLIATDLTEQKTTSAQLIQASKLATLGEMSTGMAHELNQPLNVISLAASNLRIAINKGKSSPEGVLAKVEKITAAVGRAATIIDHMRAYGRVADEGLGAINVVEVVAGTCDLLGEQLKLAGVNLINHVNASGLLVTGNAIQLEQVLVNLINNAKDAIKDTGDSGTIELSAEADDDRILLRVKDSGGGVPPDVLPHVFEPFFTTKPVGQGTGLGGSISYGIIRDMQGELWMENIEGGAQVTIRLPRRAPTDDDPVIDLLS